MAQTSRIESGSRFDLGVTSRIVLGVILGVVLIMLTAVVAAAGKDQLVASQAEEPAAADDVVGEVIDREKDGEIESVTIAIPVEEGGSIDLETPQGGVKIDTWEGNEVLLIVQKRPKLDPTARGAAKPVKIQVMRKGRGIRIAAREYSSEEMLGYDISYRLMVPESSRVTYSKTNAVYDLSKVTSVIWNALRNEAVNWLVR